MKWSWCRRENLVDGEWRWSFARRQLIYDVVEPERVYLKRWRFDTPFVSIFLHSIKLPDRDPYPHTHPFSWSRSLIVKGSYVEERGPYGDEVRRYRPGQVNRTAFFDVTALHNQAARPRERMGMGIRVTVRKLDGMQENRNERRVESPPLQINPLRFDNVVDELSPGKRPTPFAINQVLPATPTPFHCDSG
jgi:hypothetical protein